MALDKGGLGIYRDHSPVSGTHRTRVAKYRLTIAAVLLSTAAAATGSAILWPMRGVKIQASFFLSLAGSALTLFGLVFTLCLIGTQLIATRTNISIKRIFGTLTWLYLILFLITTLWTLAISYYSGEIGVKPEICELIIGHQLCISEIRAGRFSIFVLSWSLLLLLPFVAYMYYRLSPRYTFTTLVSSSLRAKDSSDFDLHCKRMSDEIISAIPDSRAVTEGLNQLLELGVIGARRNKHKGQLTPGDRAMCITKELVDLNFRLVHDKVISAQVLGTFETWIIWLICGAGKNIKDPKRAHHVSAQNVTEISRLAIKVVTSNLRLWEASADAPVRQSVNLLNEMIRTCAAANARIKVRISEALIQLADCAIAKLADGPLVDFNLAFRSLLKICELLAEPAFWSLGGEVAVRQTARTLNHLGCNNASRGQLSSWVLDELHDLTDRLSFVTSIESRYRDEYVHALAALKDDEIRKILNNPGSATQHESRNISHAWMAKITAQLYAEGRLGTLVAAQATAVGRCTNERDLPGLVALFEQIGMEYVNNRPDDSKIQTLLTTTSDNIRSCFAKHPRIVSSRMGRSARSLIPQKKPDEDRGMDQGFQ